MVYVHQQKLYQVPAVDFPLLTMGTHVIAEVCVHIILVLAWF